ncbi:hypothetical protein [Streptomyces sp. NPDC001815]|uniref:hypothetical protein n=1 Tax=Streptomyces sp. NPDC001815 TaxID=3154526 RepID=UPI0033312500
MVSKVRMALWPLIVFLPGFGALWVFWQAAGRSSELPGLFAFRSATWGDGILLPLLALCLRVMTERLRPATGIVHRRRVVTAGAFAGAAVGVTVIVMWLVEDRPALNWTMPKPHSFTAAGIWHAAFLVAACALFAWLAVDLALHLRRSGEAAVRRSLSSSWAAVALACTAGYAWLGISDALGSGGSVGGSTSLAVLVGTAIVVGCALFFVPGGFHPRYADVLLTSAILTVCLIVFVEAHPHVEGLTYAALVSATACAVGLAGTTVAGASISAVETLGVCGLFGLVTVFVSTTQSATLWTVFAAPLLAAAGAVALRWCRSEVTHPPFQAPITGPYLTGAGIAACLLAGATFGAWLGERENYEITGAFVLTIVGAVLGGVFFQYFKSDFEELMAIEGDPAHRSPDQLPGAAQRDVATRVWIRLAGFSVAAFSGILVLTISLAPSLGWREGRTPVGWGTVAIVAATAALCVVLAGGALADAWRTHPEGEPRTAPERRDTQAWSCATCGLLMGATAATAIWQADAVNVPAMVQSIVMTLFAAEAICGNGMWLHFTRLGPSSRCALATVVPAVGLSIYWSLTGLIRPEGTAAALGPSLFAWACVALSVFALVASTTSAVYVTGGQPYQTDYPPLKCAIQDTFLLTILWLTLGWAPHTVLTHVPESAPERWAAIGTILAGFMLTFCPPFLWAIESNDTHVCRQRQIRRATEAPSYGPAFADASIERIAGLPKRIRRYREALVNGEGISEVDRTVDHFIVRLSGHTAVQNAIALSIACISLVGAVGITSGFTAPPYRPPTT